MAMNKVQFQKGLSEVAFQQLYGIEDLCRAALLKSRWPEGFACPSCGSGRHCVVKTRVGGVFQCNACRTQTSVISGTIFASTKLPLTVWFRAMYHMTQTKQGISSLELARRLGVTQTTAWKIKHKLMQVMMERDLNQQIGGRVEMDDAYLGGRRSGGKTGRGSPGKIPIIAAVETTPDGKATRIKLRRIRGFTKKHVAKLATQILKPDACVVTDGLNCFPGIAEAGFAHAPVVVVKADKNSEQLECFKCVNTVLGNIKGALLGTFRAVREKHCPRILAEFEYRFNRRFDLTTIIPRLGYAAVRTPPMPFRLLTLAGDGI